MTVVVSSCTSPNSSYENAGLDLAGDLSKGVRIMNTLSSSVRSMNLQSTEEKSELPVPTQTRNNTMAMAESATVTVPSRDSIKVAYHVSWDRASTGFTITLIVPANSNSGAMESPFHKLDSTPDGKETHMLKVPLSFLASASNQSNNALDTINTAWLDRETLRARLRDGGNAIGLESSHINQSIVAVEESATRVSGWCPTGTESIKAHVILSEGFVSFVGIIAMQNHVTVAGAGTATGTQEPQFDFNYNVLNEKGSELFASSPSFKSSGGGTQYSSASSNSALRSSYPSGSDVNNNSSFLGNNNGLSSSMHSMNNGQGQEQSSSFPSISNGLFAPSNAAKTTPSSSSYASNPWGNNNSASSHKVNGAAANSGGYMRQYPPERHQLHQAQQGQVQDHSIGMNMSMNDNSKWAPEGNQVNSFDEVSNRRPVDSTRLFPSLSNGTKAVLTEPAMNGGHHPDPTILFEPMLAMGFSMVECEAAVNAIKTLSSSSAAGGTKQPQQQQQQQTHSKPSSITLPPHMASNGMQRQRSFSTTSSVSSPGINDNEEYLPSDNHQKTSMSQHQQSELRHQRQLSGEDILGYVFNSGGGTIGAFEPPRGMSTAPSGPPSNSTAYDGNGTNTNTWGRSNSRVDDEEVRRNSSAFSNGLWGNARKLKSLKNESNLGSNNTLSSNQGKYRTQQLSSSQSQWNGNAQTQKLTKVLDVPPEMNAFVFHCNAQTRDECLEKGLFGCPSGGQYGPHSKAKKGDLLFLADFSAWTVTGIFTAKSDAGLNYDKSAWNGRFPWQIKINPWTDLRTVHIDKVNEIIGLASGSKLNMLTKDQLMSLVSSKEFGPSVPSHLYKIKTMNPSNPLKVPPRKSNNGIKYNRLRFPPKGGNADEHPATALHRLKLVTSWFDSMAGGIVTMNELYNNRITSTMRGHDKQKFVLDDDLLNLVQNCSKDQGWPLLTYAYVRRAIADVFDQWLFLAHTAQEKQEKNGSGKSDDDATCWIKQSSRSNVSKGPEEDAVLRLQVPGATAYVEELLRCTTGTSALAIPYEMTKVLAIKFMSGIENISMEVQKTQNSLMKMSTENYIKSITDANLGMKFSEIEGTDNTMVQIEWHTKTSISQGRPPQVQKIYKSHFNSMKQKYGNIAAGASGASGDDPNMTRFLSRMFVLLCRYDLIGDVKNRCQAVVPLTASNAMTANFGITHECFSSPLNHRYSSFNSTLFSDIDGCFGSLGSFFHFVPSEGSFSVNPPFGGDSLKIMFDHIFGVLRHSENDKNALSFLVVIRGDNSILNHVKRSQFCRRITTLENRYKYAMNTQHKDTVAASRMQSKDSGCASAVECTGAWSPSTSTSLLWLQNDFGHDIWCPSDTRVDQVLQGFHAHPASTAIPV